MQAVKTEGVILKRRNFGEADRILTVFSQKMGKISVIAKGVRRITSRRAGNVELLNRVLMYLHKGKNFWILTEATSIETYPILKEDLTLSTYAYHIIELTDKLTAENQENYTLYEHLINVLQKLSKNPRQIFIRAYEAKIFSNLGFWSVEDIKDISGSIKDLLYSLEYKSWNEIEKIELSQQDAIQIEQILRFSIEKILESPLKSRQFLKKQ